MPFKLNVITGNLDLVLGSDSLEETLNSVYLRLDTTNDPVTGELHVTNDIVMQSGKKFYLDGDSS